MLNPRTPGVYIQELSLLPPSVAPVGTAIPAFIGYTQKRGDGFPEDTPKRITSLVDYEEVFGGPFDENYTVTLADNGEEPPTITYLGADAPYLLYYAVQHYFANGGGPCYIISVGLYDYDDPFLDPARFEEGVNAAEQEDEPTLLVVPEAVNLDTLKRTDLHNQMLGQCNKMQDRFALMDVLVEGSQSPLDDANAFRNEVGIEYLKYGAAYYPSLQTTIPKYYDPETVNITDTRSTGIYDGEPLSTLQTGTTLNETATGSITIADNDQVTSLIIDGVKVPFTVAATNNDTATSIKTAIDGKSIPDITTSVSTNEVTVNKAGGGTPTITYEGGGIALSTGPDVITVDPVANISSVAIGGTQILYDAGADAAATTTSLIAAINGNGALTVKAKADDTDAHKVLLAAKVSGPAANAITLEITGTAYALSGGTLTGGDDAGKKAATATLTLTSGYKKIDTFSFNIGSLGSFTAGTDFAIGDSSAATAQNIVTFINDPLGSYAGTVEASAEGSVITITAKAEGVAGNDIALVFTGTSGARFSGETLEGGTGGDDTPDVALYNRILAKLNDVKVDLYPSAAMAGIYARVDRARGVWKAPANVSMNMVRKTNVVVSADEQALLNVDPNTGKSVNVIRPFAGKGILVWGARTLAGNDNEWRYIPVRRLFIFIEESIQKASEPFVFEPNDAGTWIKMKGMIENFLTSLWRDKALTGASPAEAFFVKVGLGETMTALDILEGRLNIEVGIAAVRPAEFIILKFSHKLQES